MVYQAVNHGTVAGDKTGEDLFDAFTKTNANDLELYNGLGGLLTKAAPAAAITGTTSETAAANITIPGGLIGSAGLIKVTSLWNVTNSANNKTIRARLGGSGLSGTAILPMLTPMTTIDTVLIETSIIAAGATNAQKTTSRYPRGSDNLITGALEVSSTVDMTADALLVLSGQLASSGETITLRWYMVQFIK